MIFKSALFYRFGKNQHNLVASWSLIFFPLGKYMLCIQFYQSNPNQLLH